MFYSFNAITIQKVQAIVKGTSPSVTIQLTYGSDASVAGTNILTTATAITNTTTGQSITSFGSSSVTSNNWIKLVTSATSGSGIPIEIYRVTTDIDEHILSLTTTTGGIFSGLFVDNTDTLYATDRQDDTHVGRSQNGIAT